MISNHVLVEEYLILASGLLLTIIPDCIPVSSGDAVVFSNMDEETDHISSVL
jgi:hypothetical protein